MRLLIQNNRISGTATDDYTGPDAWVQSPEDFDESRVSEYRVVDGSIVIPAPASVTMRQARLALLAAGMLGTVNAAITAAGGAAQIEWEYASDVVRASELVTSMAAVLTMTDAQIDDLFIAASAL